MEQWTVAKWCREVGGDRHEFQRKVAASGVKPTGEADGRSKGAKLYRVRDLVNVALGGNYEAERLRKTKEEADKIALANAKERGEVVEIGAVIQFGEKVFAAVRQKILNMPLTDEEKDKCLSELLSLKDKDWSA